MALIPNKREVQNAPKIHKVALCCILLHSLSEYARGALL